MSSKSRASRTASQPYWSTKTAAAFGSRKKKGEKHFPVVDYLREKHRQLEELVVGPGAGAGVGCGVGIGLGIAGGIGVGGWPWNQLKLVFGVGIGCGIGVGVGYGIGIGYGLSMESLTEQKPSTRGRILHLHWCLHFCQHHPSSLVPFPFQHGFDFGDYPLWDGRVQLISLPGKIAAYGQMLSLDLY
ncbi:hypothetical protein SAY86_019726 [Trapa natans]|uniref:Uncharacterized protein n=1 Tax=Trapa natans TaxID=22666 RepID=A0AAN7LY91_TRANT|nr:hypothetical protein SAY86_019726 [Trapa natans]